MAKRVSVIIPTYNRADLLVQAVDSVHMQSMKDMEIIVVDDGSNVPVVEKIPPSSNLHIIRQENSGLNAARNSGLKVAQGDFIALLDDDDLWFPYKTEIQLAVMERYPEVSFVFSDFTVFNYEGVKADSGLSVLYDFPSSVVANWDHIIPAQEMGFPLPPNGRDYRILIGSLYQQLLYGPYVLPSTAICRREAIQRKDPFPEHNIHCGDWRFFTELTRNAPCAFVALPTAMNRSHDDAVRLTRKSPIVRMLDRLDLIDDVWRADAEFMQFHGEEVDRVESGLLYKIAIMCLLENRRKEALGFLNRWRRLPSAPLGFKGGLLSLAARIPFGSTVLRLMREAKSWGRF